MAVIDVNSQRASLLSDETALSGLPPELLGVIQDHQSHNLLDAVAATALIPRLTGRMLAHFEPVFADICARWLLSSAGGPLDVRVLGAFARILPFAPYLSELLQRYLRRVAGSGAEEDLVPLQLAVYYEKEESLLQVLVAVWRLNHFDRRAYSGLAELGEVRALFGHQSAAVRHVAIRIFCQLLEASDFMLEELVRQHVGDGGGGAATGELDGREADFLFLSLYEQARCEETAELCRAAKSATTTMSTQLQTPPQELTSLVMHYGTAVLPRPPEPEETTTTTTTLVPTPTTTANLERLTVLLQRQGAILLHGRAGAGKTALVREMAGRAGRGEGLVTLHLNEQTDAKVLVGLYATADGRPGTFRWRAGVLTTAVREGRWVLIEDLDRAPTEVVSTLLPLVERGELPIPSRGETVRAAAGFRLLATVRTATDDHSAGLLPNMPGLRLWQQLAVRSMPAAELRDVIAGRYPLLRRYAAGILAVFERLVSPNNNSSSRHRYSTLSSMAERPVSTRDLLKWCRRLDGVLRAAGCRSGDEAISETTRDRMFMEAVDCFAGGVMDAGARSAVTGSIAEAMQVSPERARHYCEADGGHVPEVEEGSNRQVRIGRVTLQRTATTVQKKKKGSRPFATTTHAARLLEQVAAATAHGEPVLLVGETGTGKTTTVQRLAETLGHGLVAVNLSQQSEAGDLLGGFKPVSARSLAVPLREEFEDLWERTGVSADRNREYLERIEKRFARGRWAELAKELRKAPRMFETMVSALQHKQQQQQQKEAAEAGPTVSAFDGPPPKRRRTGSDQLERLAQLRPRWEAFSQRLEQFEKQVGGGGAPFAFAFVEGNIVKAARRGDWVLLDEINLASADTLESIAGLLQQAGVESDGPSLLLSETGETERVRAHAEFRVFAAMNPATDVGKRDLPAGLRSRFTEVWVGSPDGDKKDLVRVVKTYLGGDEQPVTTARAAEAAADLYLELKQLATERRLADGAGASPHFSLRTLTRALTYATDVAGLYGLGRALYEGFCMGFLTALSAESEQEVQPRIRAHLLGQHDKTLPAPRRPDDGRSHVSVRSRAGDQQYWVAAGREARRERADYVVTAYVERNLLSLARAASTGRYPVLIEGPTSAGKTSLIEYLADVSGNRFVRINNHEHTELQEYVGTYAAGADGKLAFREGVLVQAMRRGWWLVLDELNLAPTEVLEALNRLLDDNRELVVAETQETVRPAAGFMLFATQNPAGAAYGGRKALSRALRNRFVELRFGEVPEAELEAILQQRCRQTTAPSDCGRMVAVYRQLGRLRQSGRVFEQGNSFATLRDLFRWAGRGGGYREQVAANGFMLLAERVRQAEEREEVKRVIEGVFRVKIEEDKLYNDDTTTSSNGSSPLVWTPAMRRLHVLVSAAVAHDEPVLLVGETGCGKTSVCQALAAAAGRRLHVVNAHQNTETGDLIGSQRPVRNRGAAVEELGRLLAKTTITDGDDSWLAERYASLTAEARAELIPDAELRAQADAALRRSRALFEWCDGSLVQAMRAGEYFLLDEISLADDSVLERLNSVLEPQRSLLLAERGGDGDEGEDEKENPLVVAHGGFQFLATMNPGGDFGKKELSPALRNRFTEIWVPPLSEADDVLAIVGAALGGGEENERRSRVMVDFATWFGRTFRPSAAFSLRDVLTWASFVRRCNAHLAPELALLHGAATVFVDTLGANPSALVAADARALDEQRQACVAKLGELVGIDLLAAYQADPQVRATSDALVVGDFSVPRQGLDSTDLAFFDAASTRRNAMRVVRAMQTQRPVLLEGSPGVGKTALVAALAAACGRPLTRVNLSDQTDMMDLVGADVPAEGAEAGRFVWRDAPFLRALQTGGWVLLDEMNLASQSVLEGLNACLDHRGEVYVAELDRVFYRHPDFCLFAAQNPHHQGGGRKGLPASLVDRFVVVHADVLSEADLRRIASRRFAGAIGDDVVGRVVRFVAALDDAVAARRAWGAEGGPWEFNLRDALRWLGLLAAPDPLLANARPDDLVGLVARQRFRTRRDRDAVDHLFAAAFGRPPARHSLYHDTGDLVAQTGLAVLPRSLGSQRGRLLPPFSCSRLAALESVMLAARQDLPCILVGPPGSGKSALLRHVAALAGRELAVLPLNADVDAMDLIGGFEQADPRRALHARLDELREAVRSDLLSAAQPSPDLMSLFMLLRDDASPSPQAETRRLEAILSRVEHILAGSAGSLSTALSAARDALCAPRSLDNPRFEWLDGAVVRAVEAGHWLVLDNANLCSASVLDRLNSLLERPAGCLAVSEHAGPDGEPRLVAPHPDFRVFLTVDPRFGELSRAMRNRSVEIFLEPLDDAHPDYLDRIAPVEAGLSRFHAVLGLWKNMGNEEVNEEKEDTDEDEDEETDDDDKDQDYYPPPILDLLSTKDSAILDRFAAALQTPGLLPPDRVAAANPLRRRLALLSGAQSSLAVARVYRPVADKMARWLAPAHEMEHKGLGQEHPSFALYRDRIQLLYPAHPLQNAFIAALVPFGRLAWLATCYELRLDVRDALQAMEAGARIGRGAAARPSSLNRFQRSCLAGQPGFATVASRDSTVHAARFLSSTLEAVDAYLREQLDSFAIESDHDEWRQRRRVLTALLHFWRRTLAAVCAAPFDEARFRAHLAQGEAVMAGTANGCRVLVAAFSARLADDFAASFELRTGRGMEALWTALRFAPLRRRRALAQAAEMERLAARFDAVRAGFSDDHGAVPAILDALARSYAAVRAGSADAAGLVADLAAEIASLEEAQSGDHQPVLASSFETLRQVLVLDDDNSRQAATLAVLSCLPTLPQMRLLCATDPAPARFQSLDYLLAQDAGARPWSAASRSLLRALDATRSASLAELRSLDRELPAMGRALAVASAGLAADPVARLGRLLLRLLDDVLAAHGVQGYVEHAYRVMEGADGLEQHLLDDVPPALSENPPLLETFRDHFLPCLAALSHPAPSHMAAAWAHFSVGCVQLYVPDKPFDPYLRARADLDSRRQLRRQLYHKLAARRAVERRLTGQNADADPACALLEDDLHALAATTAPVVICRPPGTDELARLQGEFDNVLNAVVRSDVASRLAANNNDELQLISNNVARLIDRLSSQFSAYQDVTLPLVNMLRALQVGLSLAERGPEAGTGRACVGPHEIPALLLGNPHKTTTPQFLSVAAAVVSVEGPDGLAGGIGQTLLDVLNTCYVEWSKKLSADRKAEEARQSLYRFRGGEDDEDEFDQAEFDELFGGDKRTEKYRARDSSMALAEAHARIFLPGQLGQQLDPQQCLLDLCKQAARDTGNDSGCESNRTLLAPTFLVLDEHLAALSSTPSSASPNFYADANVSETRKLLGLVGDVRARFRVLRAVDEIAHHQALADVVEACDALLGRAAGAREPLARLLPAVEQLHALVAAWNDGGWARRVDTAVELASRLADTVHAWRRLELAGWAALLDAEERRCRAEAGAWWFVAYGAVAGQQQQENQQDQDACSRAAELLRTLEPYLADAAVGQFAARLDLVRQLERQLSATGSGNDTITAALRNLVASYARFERPAADLVRAGRAPLDRQMRDVLLLFSWQDRNVAALRESSRRSHLKLFRLVRKFRAVLAQPARVAIERGLAEAEKKEPEEAEEELREPDELEPDEPRPDEFRPLQLLPGFDDPHLARLANPAALAHAMARITALPAAAVDAAVAVHSFVSGLVSEAAALRRETPSALSDANRAQVQHLRNRKAALLTDTLRAVRRMGFSRNLGTALLLRQRDAAALLADAAVLESCSLPLLRPTLDAIDRCFLQTVDLAPRFRAAARDHNDDLAGDAAERGAGHLEGILHAVVRQRRQLAQSLRSLDAVQAAVADVDALVGTEDNTLHSLLSDRRPPDNAGRLLRWLPHVLRFAAHLASVHAKLGGDGVNNQDLIDRLATSAAALDAHAAARAALPALSAGFTTPAHDDLRARVDAVLAGLRQTLAHLAHQRPDLAFVLDQVAPWVEEGQDRNSQDGNVSDNGNANANNSLDALAETVTTATKKLLVAVQGARQAADSLPTSADDPAWLTSHSDALAVRCRALRMDTLIAGVASVVAQLRTALDLDSEHHQPATALVALARPLLRQYARACARDVARLARLHAALCRMACVLARSFVRVAADGFCGPRDGPEGEQEAESGKLESGTGLGDGDGAQDISKDIQPDEDLSELAQEPNNEPKKDDMENHDDAVDMGMDELEGELGSAGGQDEEDENGDKGGGDESEKENEMDEEAGDVDDLDPTTVDEKMWDGDGQDEDDKTDKEQQGDSKKGEQEKEGEQAAGAENKNDNDDAAAAGAEKEEQGDAGDDKNKNDEGEEEDAAGEEQEEAAPREELNHQDQNVQETEALALPDDMEIDVDDGAETDDDNLDDLSDMDKPQQEEEQDDARMSESDAEDSNEKQKTEPGQQEGEDEMDLVTQEDEQDKNDEPEPEMDVDEKEEQDLQDDQDDQKPQQPAASENPADNDDDAVPSDVQAGAGQAEPEGQEAQDENAPQAKASQREQGDVGQNAADQDAAAGNEGSLSRSGQQEQAAQPEDVANPPDQNDAPNPFKKLGDALERWHRNQQEIQSAQQQEQQDAAGADMAKSEFQHLQDEDAPADTQAMGGATDDEARPLDDSMAIDDEAQNEKTQNRVLPEDETDQDNKADIAGPDKDEPPRDDKPGRDDENSGTGVTTHRGAYDETREEQDSADAMVDDENQPEDEEAMVQELSDTHIGGEQDTGPLTDLADAFQQWAALQTKTHALSLSLTAQLRLILTPTQATKLSGSFRTGKRLSIRKIIPYIASGYKRDKIWMRRSVPSRRAYQILLCVDDSRSMAESSAGALALESLVVVARALAMLEAGQVGVLGFGADVFAAHDLDGPPLAASADAGARVLQRFSFGQPRTDVVRLLRRVVDRFRQARLQAQSGSASADLWQLALVLSDGLTPSSAHAAIRPLLREAAEERIMVVFIIMDDTAESSGGRTDSVLELKEARFTPQGGVVVERYLDSFPFPYYLIVHHLEDLPGALAGLLRTWFAEVNS